MDSVSDDDFTESSKDFDFEFKEFAAAAHFYCNVRDFL